MNGRVSRCASCKKAVKFPKAPFRLTLRAPYASLLPLDVVIALRQEKVTNTTCHAPALIDFQTHCLRNVFWLDVVEFWLTHDVMSK